jgi:hypothetical protein
VVFSHALADEYVCYLLFGDQRLQVWTRTLDAVSLLNFVTLSAAAGIGVLCGSGFILYKFRARPA